MTKIQETLSRIKKTSPLILNLTNYVTMDFMANCLLSLGASPIMSCCSDEMEDLIPISKALNINIGTINSDFINLVDKAIQIAKEHKIPIILDPVGCGASAIRTKEARQIAKSCDIIKGNASEIIALHSDKHTTQGVDSTETTYNALNCAKNIVEDCSCVVVISGKTDIVLGMKQQESLSYGSEMMTKITGMGCVLGATIACFRSAIDDDFESAFLAVKYFTLCGEKTAKKHQLPGNFKMEFINQLYLGVNDV